MSLKSEIRNPKSESRQVGARQPVSDFGLRTFFGIWNLEFGFQSCLRFGPRRRAGTVPFFAPCWLLGLALLCSGPRGSAVTGEADFLVAHYPLDETNGTVAHDLAGGQDGTLRGAPVWVNPGLAFNGSSDYVDCGAAPGSDLQGALTLAAWIRPDAFNAWSSIIVKGSNASPWAMQVWSDGALRFAANQFAPPNGSGTGTWNSSTKMSAGQWHHVAVTYDGAAVRFYINGALDANQPPAALRFGVVNEPLILGADFPGGDEYFRGAIRDARVYGRALSREEIWALITTNAATVTADFAARVDPPLVKKFGVMNSGLVDYTHYARDEGKLGLARIHSQRIDLSLGKNNGFGPEIISGASNALTYSWSNLDAATAGTLNSGVLPYWGFCYEPPPLQQGGDWRSPPNSLIAWREAARAFAGHFVTSGLRLGYHEVWNEPDFPAAGGGFFSGTREQYFEMYRHAALGFREGNPDAVVGGPALAYDTSWVSPLLAFVRTNDLPLDFFGYHAVGPGADRQDLQRVARARLAAIRSSMGTQAKFATTEIHLNEYYPFKIVNWAPQVPSSSILVAPQVLDDFAFFLGFTDLTLFHFAQGLAITANPNLELSLLDAAGKPNPCFFSFACYGDLPVERCAASAPLPCGVFAGANETRAGALVWNLGTNAARLLTLVLTNVPWTQVRLSAFLVDGAARPAVVFSRSAWQMTPAQSFVTNLAGALSWRALLPANALYYLKLEPLDPPPATAPAADIIRLHHFYANRGGGDYAEFDRHTWTAHLGMGASDDARALVGVSAANLPARLQVSFATDGPLQDRNSESLLGLRVDYQGADGAFTRAVLFVGDLYHTNRASPHPWGTTNRPVAVVVVPALSNFVVNLPAFAPPGWNGRAILSFEMQNTGRGSRARVAVRASSGTTALVPAGATWQYFDQNADPGAGWRLAGYDDSAWSSGAARLGYGGDGEVTQVASNGLRITTFFRRAFTVSNLSALGPLTLRLLRDDGAVVFLNGAEVFRSNMPDGPVTMATVASSVVSGNDEQTFFPASLSPAGLQSGRNLLAVEVHQSGTNNSDLGFDCELLAELALPPPTLSARFDAGHLQLSWPAWEAGVQLFQTTNLTPPVLWAPAPPPMLLSNAQWVLSIADFSADPQRFYCLRMP